MENLFISPPPFLFLTFRASGTVYTAIDVSTGQEVRLHQQSSQCPLKVMLKLEKNHKYQ